MKKPFALAVALQLVVAGAVAQNVFQITTGGIDDDGYGSTATPDGGFAFASTTWSGSSLKEKRPVPQKGTGLKIIQSARS